MEIRKDSLSPYNNEPTLILLTSEVEPPDTPFFRSHKTSRCRITLLWEQSWLCLPCIVDTVIYSPWCFNGRLLFFRPCFIQEIERVFFFFGCSLPCFSYLFLTVGLITGINLGGQEISEADGDDIGVWCHLHRCSWSDQEKVEGTQCHWGWYRALWCGLLCCKSKGSTMDCASMHKSMNICSGE